MFNLAKNWDYLSIFSSYMGREGYLHLGRSLIENNIAIFQQDRHYLRSRNSGFLPTTKVCMSKNDVKVYKQDALGSVTGLHYDSKYFRNAKENGELCMVSGSLNITMICLRFS